MSGEALLREHLQSARFLAGQAKARWKLTALDWPNPLITVFARDGRGFVLRFDCAGYPDQPPTATVWDIQRNCILDVRLWPQGGRVSQVFNPGWKNGQALYLPCDRQSIEGHSNWLGEYPWMIWKPARGLTQYLEAVHELLQSHELHVPSS